MFGELEFKKPLRTSQRLILSQADQRLEDGKFHVVAPPGCGKTVVGLELIRRLGRPAVVFAPTTTIQEQWLNELDDFIVEPPVPESLASTDPEGDALIRVFTYQLISTPNDARERLREAATTAWVDELLLSGVVEGEDEARERIEAMRGYNPEQYRLELNGRVTRVKLHLLRSGAAEVEPFLHPNAQALIDRLVASGVGTVVLDECHHLLDYWAIVLRALIDRLHDPRTIGLTATLPSPEGDDEFENYHSLLGEVDYEVPTPAVVKEGGLAPFRDLTLFVEPVPEEYAYIKDITKAFEEATAAVTSAQRFGDWLRGQLPPPDADQSAWATALDSDPAFGLAALRFWRATGWPSPSVPMPAETSQPLELADWVALLERFGLQELKLSDDPADRALLADMRSRLSPFGLTLTERGMRHGRSAGDIVLALSRSKDDATLQILDAEMLAMGDRLRAVVITDFERMSSATSAARLHGVLPRDAGSAQRVFRKIATDARTAALAPVLITARAIMLSASHADGLVGAFHPFLAEEGVDVALSLHPTEDDAVTQLIGSGRDWGTGSAVEMITHAFELGITRCLVGTRAILGEGWDAVSLNTLIDLTSVTTRTSVQQLRGRSIRLDPSWARKVAHNWDVVCVAPGFDGGDADLRRWRKRHDRSWGIVSLPKRPAMSSVTSAVLDEDTHNLQGQIVKGPLHVDVEVAEQIAAAGSQLGSVEFADANRRMLGAVEERARVYDLWEVGAGYTNFTSWCSQLQTRDLKIKTVATISDTLKAMLRKFRATMVLGVLTTLYAILRSGLSMKVSLETTLLLALVLGTVVGLILNGRASWKLARKMLIEQPPDSILLDIGRALLNGLQAAGVVSSGLQVEFVRVVRAPDDSCTVYLDYANEADADLFIRSFREIFKPVSSQRYLILRSDQRLPQVLLQPFWASIRRLLSRAGQYQPAYLPVPEVLGSRKERALAYAEAWGRFVGGGKLVFTHGPEGRALLYAARSQQRPAVRDLAFQRWR